MMKVVTSCPAGHKADFPIRDEKKHPYLALWDAFRLKRRLFRWGKKHENCFDITVLNHPKPPVRLCCMTRHYGAQCPDGLVMCCLCFDRFPISGLAWENGEPIDVCKACKESEQTET